MNSDLILIFIYELWNEGIDLWVENKKLQVFVPEWASFTDQQRHFVTNNKEALLSFLSKNNIDCKKKNNFILRSFSKESMLSFAQERIWFIEQYEQGTNAYNTSMIFSLSKEVNLDILEQSILDIISRHEILHTVVTTNSDFGLCQKAIDFSLNPFKVKYKKVSNEYENSISLY